MELRSTREMRRNQRLDQAAAGRADRSAPAPAPSQPARPAADRVSLSRQAVSFLEEQNRRMWQYQQEREQRRQSRLDSELSALDTAKNRLKRMEDELDILNKCNKIAASIMKGNRVPTEDLRYLMEHDQAGYKLAMAMRRHNPDPKDEESVLDEEDRKGERNEASGGGEAPGVSAPEASSGGGAETPDGPTLE